MKKLRKNLLLILMLTVNYFTAQILSYDNYRKYEYPGKNWYHLKGKVKLIKVKTFEALEESGKIKQGTEKFTSYYAEQEYFEFDPQGKLLVEANIWNEDTLDPKISYSYDPGKKTISVINKYRSGKNVFRQNYSYTPEKKLLSISEKYDETPEVNKFFHFFYDKDSVIDSVMQYTAKDELIEVTRYLKNKKRQIIKDESFIYGKNSFIKKIYEYDQKGLPVKETNYRLGKPDHTSIWIYDKNGNKTLETITYDSGDISKVRFQYEFDIELNWIRRTLFVNGKPYEINVREISYY